MRCSWFRLARAPFALLLSFCLVGVPAPPLQAHPLSHNGSAKQRWTDEEITRDKWVWHLAHLARSGGKEKGAARPAVNFTDVRDMVVIEGDRTSIIPRNPFDLAGMRVLFTPAGSGYTVATSPAAMPGNMGTKLDFTASDAVNPKPEAEPGDDAYLLRDIGFAFPLYRDSYSQVAISSNGNVVFRPAGTSQKAFDDGAVDSGESLIDLRDGLPRIAPYWHDLDARSASTLGTAGVYYRTEADRVVITYNNIRDFPNEAKDNGTHRFQMTLFKDGRIEFIYDNAQLTSRALAGISGGPTKETPVLLDFSVGTPTPVTQAIGEIFSTSTVMDDFAVLDNFYATHIDNYDFAYLITDFDADLGDAFAYYMRIRNAIEGLGEPTSEPDPIGPSVASARIQGFINLANIARYPNSPTTRFLGNNHALSILGQEQGHRWGTFVKYPGTSATLLVGRDDSHWSFFTNSESNVSRAGARRSSSMEGNYWLDNSNGTFTSNGLIDGYSRYDHYLMGLRSAAEVSDTFVIANPSTALYTRSSGPRSGVTVRGSRQNVSLAEIVRATGVRTPASDKAPKSFRAVWILVTQAGTQASPATLAKLSRYRLAWESYFAQATDYLGTLNAGLAEAGTARAIAVTSGADFSSLLAPGAIGTTFGAELTAGATEATPSVDLPATLAGTQVFVDGVAAKLFFASPAQINFQAPLSTVATTSGLGVNSATALVEVMRGGELVRAGTFQVAPATPSLFTENRQGTGPAAALDAITFQPGPFNAKRAGGEANIIALYGTGAGTDATDVDGNRAALFQATIDGNPASLAYAGRAPGFPGLNQFNLTLPANITSGTHPVSISRNGVTSNVVTLAIK